MPVTEVLGDTAYGDGDTRTAVEAVGAKVTAKTQPPATTGKFAKTDFVIDPDALDGHLPGRAHHHQRRLGPRRQGPAGPSDPLR